MIKLIVGGIVALVAFIGGLAIEQQTAPAQNLGVALPGGIAVFETSLQNRISSTDTSMTLVSTSTRGGGSLSGYQCFTIDEGRSDAEYVCGDLTSAKTVSNLERGLDPLTGTTTNSSLKFAHRVGANIKITDFPLIQRMRSQLSGTDTIANLIRYDTGITPASGGDLVDYEYVTGLAFSGAGVIDATNAAKGVVELATQVETASSTAAGSSGNLAIPASNATSTYNSATAALRVVVTGNNGKISSNSWRRRYLAKGVDGLLKDASRPPRRKPLTAEKAADVVHMTLHEKPPNATHWSVRSMAAAAGISHTSVQRIWRAHGLKPHLIETFKISRDKNFAAKVADVGGLYLNPPDKALVLCVDEKSQIQALDRTQPGLPMKRGRAGTMTHDYKRNGTTTLFAALNMLDGSVIGTCLPRHRHREFLRFLKLIDQQTPARLDLHLVVDNYATHKTPAVKRWLKAHPRFHLHFTPTSASWLNMVERFFAEITRNRIRRGAFKSVAELKSAIMDYLENHNADPKPFIWTKSAGEILEKVARAKQALESQH